MAVARAGWTRESSLGVAARGPLPRTTRPGPRAAARDISNSLLSFYSLVSLSGLPTTRGVVGQAEPLPGSSVRPIESKLCRSLGTWISV